MDEIKNQEEVNESEEIIPIEGNVVVTEDDTKGITISLLAIFFEEIVKTALALLLLPTILPLIALAISRTSVM